MITVDPGDVRCDEYLAHDYFLDDPRTTTPASEPNGYFDYIDNGTTTSPATTTMPTSTTSTTSSTPQRHRRCLNDLLLSGVEPEDPLSTRVHPKPQPYISMPYFL